MRSRKDPLLRLAIAVARLADRLCAEDTEENATIRASKASLDERPRTEQSVEALP